MTHISCYFKDEEQTQQDHIMYLDWALLHRCFSLLCLMGAPGLPGLVGQMGWEVPGPIWVLNGLSPVCLPSWFHSDVTWPCSEHSSDCIVLGVHIRCFLTSLPRHTPLNPSPWPSKPCKFIYTAIKNQTMQSCETATRKGLIVLINQSKSRRGFQTNAPRDNNYQLAYFINLMWCNLFTDEWCLQQHLGE